MSINPFAAKVIERAVYNQAPVVEKVDNAIQRINHYPPDSAISFPWLILIFWIVIYPVDSGIHLLNNWGQIYNYSISRKLSGLLSIRPIKGGLLILVKVTSVRAWSIGCIPEYEYMESILEITFLEFIPSQYLEIYSN